MKFIFTLKVKKITTAQNTSASRQRTYLQALSYNAASPYTVTGRAQPCVLAPFSPALLQIQFLWDLTEAQGFPCSLCLLYTSRCV